MPLTKRQAEVLRELRRYIDMHGHAPTVKELATIMECCVGTAHYHLVGLEERKAIALTGKPYGILILNKT